MKTWQALAAAAISVPAFGWAQGLPGPYVSLGAGTNLQQNEIVTPAPTLGFPRDIIYTFHPGFAGQASAGITLPFHMRVEIEGDYLSNVVRGAQSIPPAGFTAPSRRGGGLEQKYGGFVNALYDLDLGLPVAPYVGVGVGGQEVDRSNFNQNIQGRRITPVTGPVELGYGSQTVGAFAYQAIAGFAVPIAAVPGLSFTVDYRFIGLLDPMPALTLTQGRSFHFIRSPSGAVTAQVTEVVRGNRHFTNDLNHTILLGFRYALFQPPPPPPPAPVPPPPPAPQEARTYLVFFDWDRADLTERARQIVAEAADASRHVQTTRIEVNGYTDLSGTAAYNLKLSVRRARSVEAELVRDGVPAGEIEIHGYGEADPLVSTAKGVREPQNRRVQIILQ